MSHYKSNLRDTEFNLFELFNRQGALGNTAFLSYKIINKGANTLVGAVYLLVGVIGLFIANDTSEANILSLNGADNVLHFASALVLLGVGLSQDKNVRGDAPGVPGV